MQSFYFLGWDNLLTGVVYLMIRTYYFIIPMRKLLFFNTFWNLKRIIENIKCYKRHTASLKNYCSCKLSCGVASTLKPRVVFSRCWNDVTFTQEHVTNNNVFPTQLLNGFFVFSLFRVGFFLSVAYLMVANLARLGISTHF